MNVRPRLTGPRAPAGCGQWEGAWGRTQRPSFPSAPARDSEPAGPVASGRPSSWRVTDDGQQTFAGNVLPPEHRRRQAGSPSWPSAGPRVPWYRPRPGEAGQGQDEMSGAPAADTAPTARAIRPARGPRGGERRPLPRGAPAAGRNGDITGSSGTEVLGPQDPGGGGLGDKAL